MVGDTETLSVCSTRIDTLVMPSKTLRGKSGVRLSCRTWCRISTKLAAIGVIIEDVMVGANLGTRRFSESNWEDGATEEVSIDIWACHWLEPHDSFIIVLDVLIKHFCIGRLQVFVVHDAWDLQSWILNVVRGERLVKWVVTDNVGIASKSCGCGIPEGDKLIIHVLLVEEECSEASHALLSVVVVCEHLLQAVLNERIAIFVYAVV